MLVAQSEPQVTSVNPPPAACYSDVQLSLLRTKAGHNNAAYCHAVRYRLSGRVDLISLQEKFDEAVRRWQELQSQPDQSSRPKLWIESVPGPADSPIAERRRNAELTRAVDPLAGLPCRALLLQYQDRNADLIVVAHRALLDYQSLLWIAGAPFRDTTEDGPTCGHQFLPAGNPNAVNRDECLNQLLHANYSLRADWGMGDEGAGTGTKSFHRRVTFDEGVDSASLIAAVGLVLSRYSGQSAPVIAALASDPAKDANGLGSGEGITLVGFSLEADDSADALLAKTSQMLSQPSLWYTPCVAETLAGKCENQGKIQMGILFSTDHQHNQPAPTEYVPCIAPPFPVTITCSPEAEGAYRLSCIFHPRNFAEPVMAQFIHAVLHVHRELRRNPKAKPGKIRLLDQCEEERIAALGCSSQELIVPDDRIEQAFGRIARKHPQATALSCGEDRLTYRELEEHSTRMAEALFSCGVRAGERVGVCMERSVELVEVLLAILKVGAAYVPMDPQYPAERLAYTVSDAQITTVIASRKNFHLPQVCVLEPQELLRMAPIYHESALNLSSASDAAYVIYTSGSTGRPKGVVIPHRNVIALLAATVADFQLSPADTWTLFHSSAFDFSVWEIWGCLLTGGHLVVAPYWITRNPEEFADLLTAERVTILNQTPSAFAQLLEVDRNRPLVSTLRLVIFGGEPLDARMLLPWFDRHPEFECRMVNMFGITETTVHVTLETITRAHSLSASRSVGHAMTGWYYYVMDAEARPLPLGVPGEIYVGGAGVAQGYLNRPELTAERFLSDPYNGSRMYRSGDKGRLRPDGRLEHLGRLDTQVKIRGFRIELDEIRSVLLEAPGVHTAAVVLHCDNPHDPATAKLCGYVVLNGASISEVRSHVSRVLPDYMVPAVLIELPALPLTQNGKLDTKRLPAPDKHSLRQRNTEPVRKAGDSGDAFTATLVQIWETVLGVRVGLDDNFFDLGGNSLYAMRIATAMRSRGLPALPIRELYARQTVRRLGSYLKG